MNRLRQRTPQGAVEPSGSSGPMKHGVLPSTQPRTQKVSGAATRAMSSFNVPRLITSFLEPTPLAIAIGVLFVLSIPLFLHFVVFISPTASSLPSFLLIGPSGSGKTSLLTLFERGQHAVTHTSQSPISVEIDLPVNTTTSSSKYRSINDPSLQAHKKIHLIDTPGHGKLRHYALNHVVKPQNLKGILFVVDAATISTGSSELREAAEYLHDVLLQLQKRATSSRATKAPKDIPVLIAANKLDLFTALPAPLVKSALESEIASVRNSRARGLFDSGIGMNNADTAEEKDWLGDGGEGKFEFSQLEAFGVPVAVLGGNIVGSEGGDIQKWWDWIGTNI